MTCSFVVSDSYPAIFQSSFRFHSEKKLRILNWKKLSRNIVQAHTQCIWLQCIKTSSSDSVDVDAGQIVELFCRKDIPTGVKEKHKDNHIVYYTFKVHFLSCLLCFLSGVSLG